MLFKEIEKLIELQEIDNEITLCEEVIHNFPVKKAELEEKVNTILSKTDTLKKELKQLQVEKKEQELSLRSKEEEIKNLQKRTDEVKTNKEYKAILSEIENLKKEKLNIEDQLLVIMEKEEDLNKQADEAFAESEKYKQSVAAKIDEETKKTEEKRAQLKEKTELREEAAAKIDREVFLIYEKIHSGKKDRIAICRLEGESCTGCSVFIPTFLAEKVKAKKNIVQCENCSRILY